MKKLISLLALSGLLWAGEIDPVKISHSNQQYISRFQIPEIQPQIEYPQIAFKTSLPVATTPKIHTIKLQSKTTFPSGTRFVFFGVDEVSKQLFEKEKKFDYGYCINFNSLQELKKFKEEMNLNFPIGLASDDVLKQVFKVSSYPVVIEIQENLLIIKEGL
jgi:hypothetical protein